MRISILLISLLLTFYCHASPPAQLIELTEENIELLGFKVDIRKFDDEVFIKLSPPRTIQDYWKPVTTQVHVNTGDNVGVLSKVELGEPTGDVSVNAYYEPKKHDLSIGVYFICALDRAPCRGGWNSRLYLIPSVDKFLISTHENQSP